MWAPAEGTWGTRGPTGFVLTIPGSTVLRKPAPGYFQNNCLAGLQKCFGLVFSISASCQRGASVAGAGAQDGVYEPSRGCKSHPPKRGESQGSVYPDPRAGSGTAGGCVEPLDCELFVSASWWIPNWPSTFWRSFSRKAARAPLQPPWHCRGGRVGRAWTPKPLP